MSGSFGLQTPRMNRCFLILLLLLLSLATLAQGRPRAVFVIADGIAADMLERHAAPAMKRIAASGAYLRAFVGGEKGGYTQSFVTYARCTGGLI